MKKLLTATAVVVALGAALPAAAQSWDRGDRIAPHDTSRIEQRIDRGVRDGSLTQSEARTLSRRLDEVRRLEWRYGRDGRIDRREAREIEDRYADLNNRLRMERRDGDRDRDYGYGYRR